ncbi:MAG: Glu/Leu/Phe/Val dehydrogenase dimerization domain-containing protein, partial [Bacteroidota bacterium]
INSLRNGAAGGGTRMRKGCTEREVVSLAKTMEIKFNVCGPPIGGAKSGIDFDPEDPRKEGVLRRWYTAVAPLLKRYYGTGGDLNVDEVHEVIPITYDLGVHHPQEGIVNGYLAANDSQRNQTLRQLRNGVGKTVTHENYAPTTGKAVTISDMVTGYGVAMAIRHFYQLWGKAEANKRVIIQGFGNVGGSAALTLAHAGYKIVGIIDRAGGILAPQGLGLEEIKALYFAREGNRLNHPDMIPFDDINEQIWTCGAEVFIPAAGSRLVSQEQTEAMIKNGLEVISCGANVPFSDPDIFLGEIGQYADEHVAVIPDFIANCGMARTFAYLMAPNVSMEDEAIFTDISDTIERALRKTRQRTQHATKLWQHSLSWVLEDLL